MIRIERKSVYNKPYNYLIEQIKFGKKFKKIQVFIGKNIPKDLGSFFLLQKNKEKGLLAEQIKAGYFITGHLHDFELKRAELARIDWKYFIVSMTPAKFEITLRNFAIEFIY